MGSTDGVHFDLDRAGRIIQGRDFDDGRCWPYGFEGLEDGRPQFES